MRTSEAAQHRIRVRRNLELGWLIDREGKNSPQDKRNEGGREGRVGERKRRMWEWREAE